MSAHLAAWQRVCRVEDVLESAHGVRFTLKRQWVLIPLLCCVVQDRRARG
jgi:hypothetical protein